MALAHEHMATSPESHWPPPGLGQRGDGTVLHRTGFGTAFPEPGTAFPGSVAK
ncbi:hypothetical protein ACEVG1_11305 [Parapedobacter sp. 2B3]